MKPSGNHIAYLAALVFTGLFVHLPCHAQDSNMRYWEAEKQSIRNRLVQLDFNFVFRSRVVCDSTFLPIRDCHIIPTLTVFFRKRVIISYVNFASYTTFTPQRLT